MNIKTDYSDVKFQDNGKLKLLIIVGTRPEIIRLAAVINKCRKYLRYSAHPAIVVLSYLYLLETELANIIKIVEGIRYSLAKEQIAAMISEE